jgi:hypothetical protein
MASAGPLSEQEDWSEPGFASKDCSNPERQ